jgi:hypothetical protein
MTNTLQAGRGTERGKLFLKAFRRGATAIEIARRFSVTDRCVRIHLNALGAHLEPSNPIDGMWGLPDDKRRAAIIRRAADGARETRLSMRAQP